MFAINVRKLFRKAFGPWMEAAPPRTKPRPSFRPRLEILEDRWCPSGPDAGGGGGGGGGGGNSDTLIWEPPLGNADASQASNWYDVQKKTTGTLPSATNPVILDGKYNSPINIPALINGAAPAFLSLTVQNSYNSSMTFSTTTGVTTSANDTIQSGSILTLVGFAQGECIGLTKGASFSVASGATLNLNEPGYTKNYGGIYFLFSGDSNAAGEYLNNAGTVNFNGLAVAEGSNADEDLIGVPVLNTGTFNVNGGSGGNTTLQGAILNIYKADAKTNDVSFSQTSGALNLTNNANLVAGNGYYQGGGQLTSDATPCILQAGATGNGDININNGKVIVDTVAGSVSTLTFVSSTVEFGGELDVSGLTTGGGSTRSDQLICTGAVTLGADSVLNVTETGAASLGTGNRWTVMKYASITNSWGAVLVPPTMSASTGPDNVLVSN